MNCTQYSETGLGNFYQGQVLVKSAPDPHYKDALKFTEYKHGYGRLVIIQDLDELGNEKPKKETSENDLMKNNRKSMKNPKLTPYQIIEGQWWFGKS